MTDSVLAMPGSHDPRLNIGKLAGLFRNVNKAYKFVFFHTLLDRIEDNEHSIAWDTLARGMIEQAWWPLWHYRLSFGAKDQLRSEIEKLLAERPDEATESRGAVKKTINKLTIDVQEQRQRKRGILRYPPGHLLSPWFPQDQADRERELTASELESMSRDRFLSDDPPLYRVTETGVELHPAWMEYLRQNIALLRGWANWHWLIWLQGRNPNVPMLGSKIGPPANRTPLTKQEAFWGAYLTSERDAGRPFPCIYTGEDLTTGSFVLDHFLPRSFVGHDRIWNLIPVRRTINSQKGARLPDKKFILLLAQAHSRAIGFHKHANHRTWSEFREQYALDLTFDPGQINGSDEELHSIYSSLMDPLLNRAQRMGFPSGWKPIIG
jgi:hypothetical protein